MTKASLTRFTALFIMLALWSGRGVAQNAAPVADAGLPRYAATDPVQLDGTGSYDPDSSGPLSYAWVQTAGPPVVITDANAASPTIRGPDQTDARGRTIPGPFIQTDETQECEFELVVSDGELTSVPDTVKVIIVPDFGESELELENDSFDPNKPTFIYFGGGDCTIGYTGQYVGSPDWLSRANVIDFPLGYGPDSGGGVRTYYKYGDMIIAYLSSVAPEYKQPIQTCGWSTGGQPALDVGVRLNGTYNDARYAVNLVTFSDAGFCLEQRGRPSDHIGEFLASAVDGEPCWVDNYLGVNKNPYANVLNVDSDLSHVDIDAWLDHSLTGSDMNTFNHGVVAGAYWSPFGPGKNLQLASTPGKTTYWFKWHGTSDSGHMDFYDESRYPGRLPEPVTLLAWRGPWVADDDPSGILLTCQESENAVGYQLLSGSDPYNVAQYNIVADSNRPPAVVAAMLPSSDTWWTIKARDAYGSTIHADPIPVDSPAEPDALPITLVDFNRDRKVDLADFSKLAQHWRQHEPSVDIIPAPGGARIVDVKELTILAACWLKELEDPTLIARWKLDETEGGIAYDSVGDKDATLHNSPTWQPTKGKLSGALQFDGIDDYVSTLFVLNPADGEFSVFAWIKGGGLGQVIISQIGGANWLLADPLEGNLMTSLSAPAGRFAPQPLTSETAITDGNWHRVGFSWDGSNRMLYVDNVEVATDTQSGLAGSEGGLYFGAGKDRDPASSFSGLIDDVRIYDRAVAP